MRNLVPGIISAKGTLYRDGAIKKQEAEAYVKSFDLDKLSTLIDPDTGRFVFDHVDDVYEIEKYLAAHEFRIVHADEPIVENSEGVARVMELYETIAACKAFIAEREAEAERLRKEKEEEEAYASAFFDRFKAGELDFKTLPEKDWEMIKALIASARANIPLSLFLEMTTLEQKIVASTLLAKLEEGARAYQRGAQPVTMDLVITSCLRDPRMLFNLAHLGEDPQTIWNLLSSYVVDPKLGNGSEDEGSLTDLLVFLQEPLAKEAGTILAALMRFYAVLQDHEEVKAARREIEMKTIAGYRESLELMEKGGIPEDVAVKLLCARIGKKQEDAE